MATLVLAIMGAVLGAAVGQGAGLALGAIVGALLGLVLALTKRIEGLERHHKRLEQELQRLRIDARFRTELASPPRAAASPLREADASSDAVSASDSAQSVSDHARAPDRAHQGVSPEPEPPAFEPPAFEPPAFEPPAPPLQALPPPTPPPPAPVDYLIEHARAFLLGGNTVVRVGIVVLLVGVALLVRLAAEHGRFPIEARMMGAAAIGIALIAVGYRNRSSRPDFGRTLQGGGIAALYLVVFFSYRAYALLPPSLTFPLLVAIAFSSGVLAVVQDARVLIVIAQLGGFMAPVLASSGQGSHVALFSYYLLLNVLTLAVAWVKPWRALNLVGFIFTYGVGSTWGALRYEPHHFASTEPFLLAFFALYTAIPVLYALKRPAPEPAGEAKGAALEPVRVRGWVDGTLVFGTPLATLLLQYAMVRDIPFAMAYTTLALAIVYVGLARLLHKRSPQSLRPLIEAFIAIGIGFGTLAVPYGLDNHNLTGATWALEGAGLYWLGVRQQRWISRLAGALLPVLGVIALALDPTSGSNSNSGSALPLANTGFLACVLLGLACVFIARHAHLHRAELRRFEWLSLQAFIALGLFVVIAGITHEIELHLPRAVHDGVLLAALAMLAILLEFAGRALAFAPGRLPGLLLAPFTFFALLIWSLDYETHPLGRGGGLGFPLALVALAAIALRLPAQVPAARYVHAPLLWLTALFLGLELGFLVAEQAELGEGWSVPAGTLAIVLVQLGALAGLRADRAPFARYPDVYLGPATGLLSLALLLHSALLTFTLSGDPSPLPFIPLLSPLDAALIGCFVAFAAWQRALRVTAAVPGARQVLDPATQVLLTWALAGFVFLAWNGLLARCVHHYLDVPFDLESLWRSSPFQVALSVSWSVLGLAATWLASKRARRGLWIVGACLLAVVVFKLFTLDLVRLSTLAKIGTFLVTGLLLVVVGYLAPVPPAASAREAAE